MKKILSIILSIVMVFSLFIVTNTNNAIADTEGEETTAQENINITVTSPGEYVEENNTIYFNSINSSEMQKVYVAVTDETDPDAEYKFIIADPNIAMVDTDDKGTYIYKNTYTPEAKGEGTTVLMIQKKNTLGSNTYWSTIKEVNLVVCDTPLSSVTTAKKFMQETLQLWNTKALVPVMAQVIMKFTT